MSARLPRYELECGCVHDGYTLIASAKNPHLRLCDADREHHERALAEHAAQQPTESPVQFRNGRRVS